MCGLIAIALGVVVLLRDDGAESRAPSTAEPTVPGGSPAPTETPPYPALRVVGDVPFPADLVMLTTTGGYAHGTGTPWRTRLIAGGLPGPRVFELPSPGRPDGALMGILAGPDGDPLYSTVCGGEQCFYEGPVTAATSSFYRSNDGGFRWMEVTSRDGRWWPRLGLNGDFVAVNFDGPSDAAVFVSTNEALARPEPWSGLVRYRGAPAWISSQHPMLENADGSSLLKFDFLPFEARVTGFIQSNDESRYLLTWLLSTPNPTSHGFDYRYFVTSVGGTQAQTFETRTTIGTLAGEWRDRKWLVNAEVALRPNTCAHDYAKDGDRGLSPAVFDPATGDLAFLGAPYFADVTGGCAEGAETVVATWIGVSARILAPGDCLNLRTAPGSNTKVADCLPDGAIVLRTGSTTEADGIRWASISTLGGESGWVAEAFLTSP